MWTRRTSLVLLLAGALLAPGIPTAGAAGGASAPGRARPTANRKRTSSLSLRRSRRASAPARGSSALSKYVGDRVRRASAPGALPSSSKGAQAIRERAAQRTAPRTDQTEARARRDSARSAVTAPKAGKRMDFVPRVNQAVRRWVAAVRSQRAHTVERAHARHQRTSVEYPPNLGFEGPPRTTRLAAGTRMDRYGYEGGRFASPEGTPFEQRALPAEAMSRPRTVYRATVDLEVLAGPTAPWFGQPGRGTQYYLPASVRDLMAAGKLERGSE